VLTGRTSPVRQTLLEAAIDAACIASCCAGPVRLIDPTPQLTATLSEAGLPIDANSTTIIASGGLASEALSLPHVARVFIPVVREGHDALAAEAAARGFSVVVVGSLDFLGAVSRNSRRVPPEFWRRIFAWLERAPALRAAVAYAEAVASRILPTHIGLRLLLECTRDGVDVPSQNLTPVPQWSENEDIGALLLSRGLDPERVQRDIAVLLERDPRSAVILWFVAATLVLPAFDAAIARLCPQSVIAEFDNWTRNDAMDRNVGEIAQTWYRRLLPSDVLTYRGLEIGFALETDSVKELLDVLHFTPLRDGA
jgi:hypothetical protein